MNIIIILKRLEYIIAIIRPIRVKAMVIIMRGRIILGSIEGDESLLMLAG